MELRERIIEEATNTFFRLGIKAVTMDDIASAIGVSKKTLYTEFNNKKALVFAVMERYLEMDKELCECNLDGTTSAIEEMLQLREHMEKRMSHMNPLVLIEAYKYYPQTWALLDAYKEDFVLDMMRENLKRGIKEGLYRQNIDVDIMARLKIAQFDWAFEGQVFPSDKYNFLEVDKQLMYHYLFGICSIKGHEFINKYLKIKE